MQRCWLEDSEERPSFTDLSSIMDAMLSSVSDYAELNMKLPHNSQESIGDQLMVVTVTVCILSVQCICISNQRRIDEFHGSGH